MKTEKYEFYILHSVDYLVNKQSEELQNDGWELAGEVKTEKATHGDSRYVIIPFKRKLTEQIESLTDEQKKKIADIATEICNSTPHESITKMSEITWEQLNTPYNI